MDWLLAPIDPGRVHEVGFAVSWHARVMTLAWGILAPMAVLVARYFKVMPGQDWPRELDRQTWWRVHLSSNIAVVLLTVFGVGLILGHAQGGSIHGVLGYCVLALLAVQATLGVFRGTKGGPTARAKDGSLHGDHYDMTPWRVAFEWLHKTIGYVLVALAAGVIVLGLWDSNAPRWMWLAIGAFWTGLAVGAVMLQRRGFAIDTYQAIWGPDPRLPGNQRRPIGWGVRRPDTRPGE